MKPIKHILIAIVGILFISTSFLNSQNCEVPDNGTGTATLPPIGCNYQSVDPFMIIDGLPPGTTIELHGIYSDFNCCGSPCPTCSLPLSPGECEMPGGSLGGDGHCFTGLMTFEVIGTGDLDGFNRTLFVEIFSEIHTGPRNPGDPVQTFPADYYRFEGDLVGDPDFCAFHIIAGTNFGLPSPGQTTLTELPSGDFEVDSFFDITYQIEFEGCPGSVLEGFAGTTTATTDFEIPYVTGNDFIDPGSDYWTVPEGPSSSVHPGGPGGEIDSIPADFFGPGSDPFDGVIFLRGESIGSTEFPNPDAIIERISQANLPEPYPVTDQVQTEIVELNLVSTVPITVTYNGGTDPELWDVQLELLPSAQPIGNMDITKNDTNGGVFNYSPLLVSPRLIFTQVDPPYDTVFYDPNDIEYTNPIAYPWKHSPIGNDFNPADTIPLELISTGGDCELYLNPYLLRQDDFWVNVDPDSSAQGGGSGYNDGEWYYYPNTDWWNIWFYDHPFSIDRTKEMNISFTIDKLNPGLDSYATIVFNWSTGDWSGQGVPGRPPLPDDVIDPDLEDLYIVRSTPIFDGLVNGPILIDQYFYEILEYNPEWISIDINGYNYTIPDGTINHVCKQPDDGGELYEFGDAPELALAYPSLGITGIFPTCMNVPVAGFITHIDGSAWFGPQVDYEPEGNAGFCPTFNPDTYNQDECFNDGDAGLIIPDGFTITGPIGSEVVQPCTGANSVPLGYICQTAEWGVDIDIDLHNHIPSGDQAYINLLIDWNQDGQWGGSIDCPGYAVPEHVLVDFPIPNTFDGPLSTLMPAGSTIPIGSNPGYVWVRFSISEVPVGQDWNGEGFFDYGETEDYLLLVNEQQQEIDWGDAPDNLAIPQYPTLLANNGAGHIIDGVTFLGALIDGEPDGLPDSNALGDDNNNLPDEDGIVFNQIIQGSPAQITVTTSTAGYLQGWMDFNADGDWADPGEQIFTDEYIHFGYTVCLNYIVPVNASIDTTYARFRFSTVQGLTYTGLATDGEVEDYEVVIVQNPDIKWLQEPCVQLPGLHCTDDIEIIADDWECHGGLVTDIHWWGNYENNDMGSGINYFHLSIHDNDPSGSCLPIDPEIWGKNVPLASANETSTGLINNEGSIIYKYDYILDIPFEQTEGNYYWLDICAYTINGDLAWRWQESDRSTVPILCSAASRTLAAPPWWQPIDWLTPPPTRYSDMAFVITSEEFVNEYDYGDAPDGTAAPLYPTLAINNGANHLIDNITYLGISIDGENDGIPDINALGDDNNNLDDEDGVVFPVLRRGNTDNLNITANVSGTLNAWFDFNADGDWADATEHVLVDVGLAAGLNNVPLTIPSSANADTTYARFRFASYSGLSYDGGATNGEVEDYMVVIWDPIPSDTSINGVTIGSGQSECYNATDSIIVAATAPVVVQSGGNAIFIAGNLILFNPGFDGQLGSTVDAHITTGGNYCNNPGGTPMVPLATEVTDIPEEPEVFFNEEADIKLYPNPNTGQFTIDFMKDEYSAKIWVMNFQGIKLFQNQFSNQRKIEFDLSTQPTGMYLVMIQIDGKVVTMKVIKN